MAEGLSEREVAARASIPWVVGSAGALAVIGLLAIQSATGVDGPTPWGSADRQGAFLILAVCLGVAAAAFGYRRAAAWSRFFLIVSWVLLFVVLFTPERNGSRRWMEILGVHLQPSEIAKIALVLFLSWFAIQRGERLATVREGLLPALGYLAVTAGLVMSEPDNGQTLYIAVVAVAVLLVNGLRIMHVLPPFAVGLPLLLFWMVGRHGYIRERLDGFLAGNQPSDHQVVRAREALAAGGLLGRGVGDGRAQLDFVPELQNDFILAGVGEQAGLVGTVVVVALFGILVWHGIRIARNAHDRLGFSIAFGLTFMLGLQAAINVAVVTGSVPPKGIALPFVSLGGSSLVMSMISIGLVVSVALARAEQPASSRVARGRHGRDITQGARAFLARALSRSRGCLVRKPAFTSLLAQTRNKWFELNSTPQTLPDQAAPISNVRRRKRGRRSETNS